MAASIFMATGKIPDCRGECRRRARRGGCLAPGIRVAMVDGVPGNRAAVKVRIFARWRIRTDVPGPGGKLTSWKRPFALHRPPAPPLQSVAASRRRRVPQTVRGRLRRKRGGYVKRSAALAHRLPPISNLAAGTANPLTCPLGSTKGQASGAGKFSSASKSMYSSLQV